MKTAFMIIDVQNDMFREVNPVFEGEKLLKTIGQLISKARESGVPVIYVQHNSTKGNSFVHGTHGWEIHSRITPEKGDVIIQKTTPDSFYETNLKEELDRMGIKGLVISGIQSELCVDTTCRRAKSLDYDVTLVSDGHSTFDGDNLKAREIIDHHNSVLNGWFADLKTAGEIDFTKMP